METKLLENLKPQDLVRTLDGEFLLIGERDEKGCYETTIIGCDEGRLYNTCIICPLYPDQLARFELVDKISAVRTANGDYVDDNGNAYRINDDGVAVNKAGETFAVFDINSDDNDAVFIKVYDELCEFVKKCVSEITWLEDAECIDERDMEDVFESLRDCFRDSKWDTHTGNYDDWYDDFAENVLVNCFTRLF